jgi:hypothetical protein
MLPPPTPDELAKARLLVERVEGLETTLAVLEALPEPSVRELVHGRLRDPRTRRTTSALLPFCSRRLQLACFEDLVRGSTWLDLGHTYVQLITELPPHWVRENLEQVGRRIQGELEADEWRMLHALYEEVDGRLAAGLISDMRRSGDADVREVADALGGEEPG